MTPTPPDNELREQIKTRFFAAVEYGAKNPDVANDALRIRMLDYVDETMDDFAQAKQAWTVEARRDGQIQAIGDLHVTLQMNPDIAIEDLKVMAEQRMKKLQAELQPPTAESEAEG